MSSLVQQWKDRRRLSSLRDKLAVYASSCLELAHVHSSTIRAREGPFASLIEDEAQRLGHECPGFAVHTCCTRACRALTDGPRDFGLCVVAFCESLQNAFNAPAATFRDSVRLDTVLEQMNYYVQKIGEATDRDVRGDDVIRAEAFVIRAAPVEHYQDSPKRVVREGIIQEIPVIGDRWNRVATLAGQVCGLMLQQINYLDVFLT